MILSQTKIFNFFPSSIQLGQISGILTIICDRKTICYIPSRDLRINRFHIDVSNKNRYSCVTINCRNSGLAKYRTNLESNLKQFCFYAQKKR